MQKKCYQKEPNIVSRKIGDEVILVPIKRKLANVNAIYLLQDDVSIRIWELIDGRRKVHEIIDIICAEFEVDQQEAEDDLIKFLKQLIKAGGIMTEEVGKSITSEECI